MREVGALKGWRPQYSWGSDFEKEVKAEVLKAVPLGRSFGTVGFFARAALLIAAYMWLEWSWATAGSSVKLAVALGIVQAIALDVKVIKCRFQSKRAQRYMRLQLFPIAFN